MSATHEARAANGGKSKVKLVEKDNSTVKKKAAAPDKKAGENIRIRRLQIALSEKAYTRLDELKKKTDASSATDVIRDALRLYDALVDEVAAGKVLILQDPAKPNEKEIIRLL